MADDLRVRGAHMVAAMCVDVLDLDRHLEMIDTSVQALGGLDQVVIAYGDANRPEGCRAGLLLCGKRNPAQVYERCITAELNCRSL